MLPGLAALDDADRGDRSSAEFGSAGLASLGTAREVSDSGDSVVRTVWPAEAGRPSVCRVAGVGPSTAGVGPVTAVSEHAASRTHASTTTGTSVPILTPPALTTPATVPGTVGTVVSNRVIAKDPPQPALRHLSTTVFSSANRNHCLGAVAGLLRKSTSSICQPHLQSPGAKAGLPTQNTSPVEPAAPQSPPAPSHRQRGARDHHCQGETRVSTRHPSSLWQCSHSNRRSGPHQLFGNGSRSIGQLMHRGPPRPDPNSEPGMVSTSMPAASRRRLVSTLRL